jgi:hypothetical protein
MQRPCCRNAAPRACAPAARGAAPPGRACLLGHGRCPSR